ncbi:hypothetical protein C8R44DRAFT_973518 [Mycena epipterygia]|nr:hypothetical protein C8R44DRAFT_973518 [Mycena epipterygia]
MVLPSNVGRVLCDDCTQIPFQKSHLLSNPTQFSHLRGILRSNALPPAETSRTFQHVMAEMPLEIARYDSEIKRLQERLDELKSDREKLQSYAHGCRSVFSPVRRLPPELLIEIFEMCAPPGVHYISETTTPIEELERLAKKYLLQLSQVCSHWYGLVMGTARLWSTIVVDTTLWSEIPASPPTLIDLVVRSLEHSGSHPLSLQCAVSIADSNHELVLELLAQHSGRWRQLYFWNDLPSFQIIAAVKGNLPLLEGLDISNQNNSHWTDTGSFAVAPRLNKVTFTGNAAQIPTLPWGQILDFIYYNSGWNDLVDALNLIHRLSTNSRCDLSLDISDISIPIHFPPIVSNVSRLFMFFTADPNQEQTTEILGAVLASLTLPCLQELGLCRQPNAPPLFWHQHHFLTFASRSALHANLTVFEIQAIIQDEELLQCLSVLPVLEQLVVWDCEDPSHSVITDNLLRGLVWRPDYACIVPSLNWLWFSSIF